MDGVVQVQFARDGSQLGLFCHAAFNGVVWPASWCTCIDGSRDSTLLILHWLTGL